VIRSWELTHEDLTRAAVCYAMAINGVPGSSAIGKGVHLVINTDDAGNITGAVVTLREKTDAPEARKEMEHG